MSAAQPKGLQLNLPRAQDGADVAVKVPRFRFPGGCAFRKCACRSVWVHGQGQSWGQRWVQLEDCSPILSSRVCSHWALAPASLFFNQSMGDFIFSFFSIFFYLSSGTA